MLCATRERAQRAAPSASAVGAAALAAAGAARWSRRVLALALSEGLRSKVLDLLFGAEEEFDYSSTTMPAEPAPGGRAGLLRLDAAPR